MSDERTERLSEIDARTASGLFTRSDQLYLRGLVDELTRTSVAPVPEASGALATSWSQVGDEIVTFLRDGVSDLAGNDEGLCGAPVNSRPSWMGVDQFDPCLCTRPAGHDRSLPHACKHTIEET